MQLNSLNLIQIVAAVIAFAAAGSKLLKATVPFWGSMPPIVQRFLPGAVLVLGALPGALAGVTTWVDFSVAVLGALAFATPGRHTNIPVPHPPETKKPPLPPESSKPEPEPEWFPPSGPVAFFVLAFVALSQQACRPQQDPCSEANMAALVAQCRAKVEAECQGISDEDCPAVKSCDAEVDRRCGAPQ